MNTIEKLGDEETFRQIVERNITSFIDNELTALYEYSFYGCKELQEVSLPLITEVPGSAFQGCSKLTTFDLSNITKISRYAFYSCGLTEVNGPLVASIEHYAFRNCSSLSYAKFPKVTSIQSLAIYDCPSLSSLIVGTELDDETAICTLANTDALPPSIGAIYVPYNLVEKYKTATNWSSFASKIQAYDVPVSCQSLTITAEDVPWSETSTKIHYEAVCTYSIEGIMQPETKIFKGDVVSDTFGTNSSEESSRQVEVSYTFLGQTATTTITQDKYRTDLVGGTIFYIDSSADGEYEFYNINGELISNVAVGDKPYSYKVVTPGAKDKYYVLHDKLYSNLKWTYYKNGSSVTISLGTGTAIGTGKSNTATVMAADDGAYITADSKGYPTIWYKLQQTRDAFTGGNNDWFVPSKDEAYEVKKAGLMESEFKNNDIWSSSESSGRNVWLWSHNLQRWLDNEGKFETHPVFFIRAF